MSAFALTVASVAMSVRIESPFAFVVHRIAHRPKKRGPSLARRPKGTIETDQRDRAIE